MSETSNKARFHSDSLVYTPHGLGVAYSNANLTDQAARHILALDPDARQHFATLPPAGDSSAPADTQPAPAPQTAPAPTQAPVAAPLAQAPAFDYAQLAKAMFDEGERRESEARAKQGQQDEQDDEPSNLAASTGGADEPEVHTEVLANNVVVTTGTTEAIDESEDDGKPVRLSRMNKEQLVAAYRSELHLEPLADLTNEELRTAIGEHRATQQDAE